jgi:ABC-2 type transport system permease protein
MSLGLLPRRLAAAGAVCRRDTRMYLSYRSRVLSQAISVLVSLTMFYYVSRLVSVEKFGDPQQYFSFVVIGLVVIGVMQAALGIAVSLRSELLAGTFERFVSSPFGAVDGIASMVLFPIMLELVFSTLTLVLGAIIFGVPVTWATAPLALLVGLAGAVIFATIGLLFAAAVLVFKQASGVVGFVATAIGLFGGVYFPVTVLPAWGEWIANAQPLTAAVDLMRHWLIDYELTGTVAGAILRMGGFLVVLVPVAFVALSAAVRFSRRRATVLEY